MKKLRRDCLVIVSFILNQNLTPSLAWMASIPMSKETLSLSKRFVESKNIFRPSLIESHFSEVLKVTKSWTV